MLRQIVIPVVVTLSLVVAVFFLFSAFWVEVTYSADAESVTPPREVPYFVVPSITTPERFRSAGTTSRTPVSPEVDRAIAAAAARARAEAEADAAMAELREERARVVRLREELAHLRLELLRRQYPEETPFGLFLRSPEADSITDEKALQTLRFTLQDLPVFLLPGEATWIAERARHNDWKNYGATRVEALIQYLGPARVLDQVPHSLLAAQREFYEADEWESFFR